MIGALLIRFGASRADLKAEADLGVQAMAEDPVIPETWVVVGIE